jgi:TonB family protein
VNSGRVTLDCRIESDASVTDCQVQDESPQGYGFGESALAAVVRARLAPQVVEQAAPDARAVFTLGIPLVAPRPRAIVNPEWISPPSPKFPATAAAAGVSSATVALTCTATVAERLANCRVRSESHPGLGFAEAALAATASARIRPRTIDGEATDSEQSFTVRFRWN